MSLVATAGGLPSRLGKYEVLFPLATGGMARIYIGRTTGIGAFERHVVLKIILPERAHERSAIDMFLDEARLASMLNHQNVAQVFDVGEDAGIHFLAMEYVHGQDLRAVLANAGASNTRIPIELGLAVVAAAAAGLHHAHERRGPDGRMLGIVHRDVSPSNIMVGYDGSVKVLDFGIAKAAARSAETVSGVIKGKFAYMAPEQCRGKEVDRRSDVFALGIILYEITTQQRCFRADNDFDTMHRIVTGDVVKPTKLLADFPKALEAIILKALTVDPAGRYQTAGELLEAIEQFAIANRISLSTMAFGRFMREMFGEVPEPWLSAPARERMQTGSAEYPRESTVSNTNSSASQGLPTLKLAPNKPNVSPLAFGDDDGDDASDEEAWNAKSFPTMQPNFAAAESLPAKLKPYAAVVRDADAARAAQATVGSARAGSALPTPPPLVPARRNTPQPFDAPSSPSHVAAAVMSASAAATAPGPMLTPPARRTSPGLPTAPNAFASLATGSALHPVSAGAQATPAPAVSPLAPSSNPFGATPTRSNAYVPAGSPVFGADSSASALSTSGTGLATYHSAAPAANRTWLWVVLAVVACITIAAVVVIFRDGGPSAPAATPAVVSPALNPATNDSAQGSGSGHDPSVEAHEQAGSAAAPGTRVPRADADPAVEITPATVPLRVDSVPTGAEVFLAGRLLGKTPLRTTLARGEAAVGLEIRHAKYQTAVVTVTPNAPIEEKLEMRAVVMPTSDKRSPAVPTKSKAKPAAKCIPYKDFNELIHDPKQLCKENSGLKGFR